MIKHLEITIWNRKFLLPVDYDCDSEKEITCDQIDSLNSLISHPILIENAKIQVENYCRKKLTEDKATFKKNNIFTYVMPSSIFVKKELNNPRVAILCNYKYDMEHGLAIVFTYEGKVTVGNQDIIL